MERTGTHGWAGSCSWASIAENDDPHFSTWLLHLLSSIYTSTKCSWHLPVQKSKKRPDFTKVAFFEKKHGPSPMKSVTFYWTWIFSWKRLQTAPQISHEGSSVFIYWMMSKRYIGFGWTNDQLWSFWNQSLFYSGASYKVQRSKQHMHASSLMSFDSYPFRLAPHGIWRWVAHCGLEI
jgi:hypothetical protein